MAMYVVLVVVVAAVCYSSASINVEAIDDNIPESPRFISPHKMHKTTAKPEGNMLHLKCPAQGNPSPNITWSKDGSSVQREVGQVFYGRWCMRLEDLVTADSGNYTCVVCNLHGCVNFTSHVYVVERLNHRPTITQSPRNTTVVVGASATLHCSFLSDLQAHLVWRKDSLQHLGNTIFKDIQDDYLCPDIRAGTSNSKFECDNFETLSIHNVTEEDVGWYTCIVGNSLGITHASAHLNVVEGASASTWTVDRGFAFCTLLGFVVVAMTTNSIVWFLTR